MVLKPADATKFTLRFSTESLITFFCLQESHLNHDVLIWLVHNFTIVISPTNVSMIVSSIFVTGFGINLKGRLPTPINSDPKLLLKNVTFELVEYKPTSLTVISLPDSTWIVLCWYCCLPLLSCFWCRFTCNYKYTKEMIIFPW